MSMRKFNRRRWLRPINSNGRRSAILYNGKISRSTYDKKQLELSLYMVLNDCHEDITWDFSVYKSSKKWRQHLNVQRRSVATLRKEMNTFCDKAEQMMDAFEHYE